MDKRNVLNKAHLVEPIIRHTIQDSLFYKQHLYLTNELTIVPVVVNLVHYIGGTNSSGRPSPFLCCLLRMLELEPDQDIISLYLRQNGYNEFKYLTALTLLYCRMVAAPKAVFTLFDEYIVDYRRLRFRLKLPQFVNDLPVHYIVIHMDEWIDSMVENERVVDLALPYLPPRQMLVQKGEVDPRQYAVSEDEASLSDYESDSD
ncbi:CIC11C00000004546 [Sungouiella intermedia]|uniref:Pre-mRNA-splicing factor 38 n=1 Tax=Sungouiella intermedia TaxID=45354 RepID=A0A1L0CVH2_9ASCO|nr:CIC11C00000004546 [[Candida] intermedia]